MFEMVFEASGYNPEASGYNPEASEYDPKAFDHVPEVSRFAAEALVFFSSPQGLTSKPRPW